MRKASLFPLAAVVLVAAVLIGLQLNLLRQGPGQVLGSPTPSPSPSPTVSPTQTATPTPSPSPAAARTPEELADRLGAALEASDWAALEKLTYPAGWIAAWWGSEGTPSMSPAEVVAWLRQGTQDGRLEVSVEERPIQVRGEEYVTSVWRNFDSRSGGRRPSQNAWLVFRQDAGGAWYWSMAIYNPHAMPDGP